MNRVYGACVVLANAMSMASYGRCDDVTSELITQLECGPMPNVMVALPNIGGALCSTPQFG